MHNFLASFQIGFKYLNLVFTWQPFQEFRTIIGRNDCHIMACFNQEPIKAKARTIGISIWISMGHYGYFFRLGKYLL